MQRTPLHDTGGHFLPLVSLGQAVLILKADGIPVRPVTIIAFSQQKKMSPAPKKRLHAPPLPLRNWCDLIEVAWEAKSGIL